MPTTLDYSSSVVYSHHTLPLLLLSDFFFSTQQIFATLHPFVQVSTPYPLISAHSSSIRQTFASNSSSFPFCYHPSLTISVEFDPPFPHPFVLSLVRCCHNPYCKPIYL